MDASQISALLAALHRGVTDNAGWDDFAMALRTALDADHANITFRRNDAPMCELISHGAGGPLEDMERFYLGGYYQDDPLPYHRLVPGEVYGLADLFDAADSASLQRVNRMLLTMGVDHLLITRAAEEGGGNAWLTVARKGDPFDASARTVLGIMARHLMIALASYARILEADGRLSIYAGAINRLNVGIVTLAGDGRILDADPIVTHLIGKGDILVRDPQGRLGLKQGQAARSLGQALRDFAKDRGSRPRAIRLSEEPRSDMLALPVADPPATGRYTPVLRAYVHIDGKPRDSLEALMDMFRLTRSEARLALALGEGLTLAEAAANLGVTLQTARTYSKRIFQKTGTRRQAELVRALLTSTLSLA